MQAQVRGEGRPLLYLQSAAGPAWSPFLLELAKTHTVHLPVLPGLAPQRELALAVAGYIESSIGGPCDVMGHSFGGAVALWLAAERPQWIDHLVLAACAAEDAGLAERLAAFDKATLILQGTRDRLVVEAAA